MAEPPLDWLPPNILEDGAAIVVACESPPNVKLLDVAPLAVGCETPPNVKLDAGGIVGVLVAPNVNGALEDWL